MRVPSSIHSDFPVRMPSLSTSSSKSSSNLKSLAKPGSTSAMNLHSQFGLRLSRSVKLLAHEPQRKVLGTNQQNQSIVGVRAEYGYRDFRSSFIREYLDTEKLFPCFHWLMLIMDEQVSTVTFTISDAIEPFIIPIGRVHPPSALPIGPSKRKIQEIAGQMWGIEAFPVLPISKLWSIQFIFFSLAGSRTQHWSKNNYIVGSVEGLAFDDSGLFTKSKQSTPFVAQRDFRMEKFSILWWRYAVYNAWPSESQEIVHIAMQSENNQHFVRLFSEGEKWSIFNPFALRKREND
jgi:hypothetical protein